MWLPNFGEQVFMGDEAVLVSDDTDLKRIRGKYLKGLMKTHE